MLRVCFILSLLFTGSLTAQDLPCDHPDRIPLEIKLPNVFTPNDDGANDLFRSDYNINSFDRYTMHIYNRAGQLIFFADRSAQGWNGRTPSGTKCPEGTYFFIIDYQTPCESDRQSGVFDLIR